MTKEELTKAVRELAEKNGITPAAAAALIVKGGQGLLNETPTEETKDNEPNDID